MPTAASGEPLKVGFVYLSGNAASVIGMGDFTPSDSQRQRWVDALTEQVNATGGLAGRPIEVVVRPVDSTDSSASTQEGLQTEACVALTEDEQVDMVLALDGVTRTNGCYVDHQTPIFIMSEAGSEQEMLEARPYVIPNPWLNLTNTARLMVHGHCLSGWASGGPIGVIHYDDPGPTQVVSEVLVPGFTACGGEVPEVIAIKPSADTIGAEMSSAVLQFRAAGVDRVNLFAGGGGGLVFFGNAAESQGYRPLIGTSSLDRPAVFAQTIPPAQQANLSGVGFHAAIDVPEQVAPPLRPREQECFDLLNEQAGESFSGRGNPAVDASPVLALATCDAFWATQFALRSIAGQPFEAEPIINAFFAVGETYDPVLFPYLRWGAERSDAIDAWAPLAWDAADCSCLRYTTDWQRLPF